MSVRTWGIYWERQPAGRQTLPSDYLSSELFGVRRPFAKAPSCFLENALIWATILQGLKQEEDADIRESALGVLGALAGQQAVAHFLWREEDEEERKSDICEDIFLNTLREQPPRVRGRALTVVAGKRYLLILVAHSQAQLMNFLYTNMYIDILCTQYIIALYNYIHIELFLYTNYTHLYTIYIIHTVDFIIDTLMIPHPACSFAPFRCILIQRHWQIALRNVIFDRLWTTFRSFGHRFWLQVLWEILQNAPRCGPTFRQLEQIWRSRAEPGRSTWLQYNGHFWIQSNILSHKVWHRTYMTKSQAVLQGSHLGRMFAVCKYSCTVCLKWSVWIARVLARTLPCTTAAKKERPLGSDMSGDRRARAGSDMSGGRSRAGSDASAASRQSEESKQNDDVPPVITTLKDSIPVCCLQIRTSQCAMASIENFAGTLLGRGIQNVFTWEQGSSAMAASGTGSMFWRLFHSFPTAKGCFERRAVIWDCQTRLPTYCLTCNITLDCTTAKPQTYTWGTQ